MASAAQLLVTPQTPGHFAMPHLSDDSAKKTSELLQENHEKHHIFFNDKGFHNHIVHHLLAIYALGATPGEIEQSYDDNLSYQRKPLPVNQKIVSDLKDPANFKKYIGQENYYNDYLVFFKNEIQEKGYQTIVKEYLFKGDEASDDLLARTYAGILHPIIHLGYGIEFQQPAIIAEALAQAAVHNDETVPYLLAAEAASKKHGDPSKSVFTLLDEIRSNQKLRDSAHWDGAGKIFGSTLARAQDEMVALASQYIVSPDSESNLALRTAEMTTLTAFFTGPAQRPPKQVKMDFFLMHAINCSIFFPALLAQDWLAPAHKARLLAWKVRLDLAVYVGRGAPDLDIAEVRDYVPHHPDAASWEDLYRRTTALRDDGHASKFVRALASGERFCRPFEGQAGLAAEFTSSFAGADWLQMANMVVDSVEGPGPNWVFGVGFAEAWESIGERRGAKL